jgi:hypothetical protein
VAYPEHLPTGRLARVREHWADAQCLPKFAQTTQNGSFGQLATQVLSRLRCGEPAVFVQGLPQLEHQRRHFVAGRFLRSMLPIGIATKREHVGQRLACSHKIRLLTHSAQQVQRHRAPLRDQARQQRVCLLDRLRPGCSVHLAHAGFYKGRRGRRQLRAPGQVKAKRMLFEPARCLFEREDGILLLAPVRRLCCLELLSCQNDSALSEAGRSRATASPLWLTKANNFSGPGGRGQCSRSSSAPVARDRLRYDERLAGFLSKHTAGRWGGHGDNWSDARFWPARPAATACAWSRAECSL